MRTLVIAEAGVNHNGDLSRAIEMVHVAARAGADMVKFQTFRATSIAAAHAPQAVYQQHNTGIEENQQTMIGRLELAPADHVVLKQACAQAGIAFFSTGFDAESVDMLVDLGIDRIKVPSGEITNLPLLRHIAAKRLPVIVSTGMATLGEVEAAIDVLEADGLARAALTVLHCTTEYPTPLEEVNLHAMTTMGRALGVAIGYSDHTLGTDVAIAAVALGATVIEKHFTLSRDLPGPDHRASLEPGELTAMVSGIRAVEKALQGDGVKRPTPSERRNKPVARKSIVASRPIAAGERLSAENLTTKRPGTGMSPMAWDDVIGRVAPRDFAHDEIIAL